jgi:hypothetical protein
MTLRQPSWPMKDDPGGKPKFGREKLVLHFDSRVD